MPRESQLTAEMEFTWLRIGAGSSLVIFVGRFGCRLQLLVGLIQKFLGMSSVALHVEFIGLLRGADLFKGLLGESLRCGQVRMPRPANVPFGSLRDE